MSDGVRATDTDGLYAQTTLDLTVNQVPTAPTVSLAPYPAYTTDTLTASASGSLDPDGSGTVTYDYAWYVDGTLSGVSTSATFPSSDTQKDSSTAWSSHPPMAPASVPPVRRS